MSPIIELQRRMVEAGRIRAGEKGEKGEPRKLTHWRLTSKDRVRLEHAAVLWGGDVREWEGRQGEFELYTDTDALPIMLLPGQMPTSYYELWSKGGCQRRCDGERELLSDEPCLCGDERECKPYTRLSVLLPDLPGIGSWLLSSTGWNAAAELAGAADVLQRASAQGTLIPARLRLEPRVDVKAGQTRRYAVPVIDLDVSFRELLGTQVSLAASDQAALPSGYTPIATVGQKPASITEGIRDVETAQLTRTSRSAVAIPETTGAEFGTGPVAVPDESAAGTQASPTPSAEPAADPSPKPLTQPQAKKLNVLIGQLRDTDEPKITTGQLWSALAKERGVEVDTMIELLSGRDEEGIVHWSPLRDSLTRGEAASLIDRLEAIA